MGAKKKKLKKIIKLLLDVTPEHSIPGLDYYNCGEGNRFTINDNGDVNLLNEGKDGLKYLGNLKDRIK